VFPATDRESTLMFHSVRTPANRLPAGPLLWSPFLCSRRAASSCAQGRFGPSSTWTSPPATPSTRTALPPPTPQITTPANGLSPISDGFLHRPDLNKFVVPGSGRGQPVPTLTSVRSPGTFYITSCETTRSSGSTVRRATCFWQLKRPTDNFATLQDYGPLVRPNRRRGRRPTATGKPSSCLTLLA